MRTTPAAALSLAAALLLASGCAPASTPAPVSVAEDAGAAVLDHDPVLSPHPEPTDVWWWLDSPPADDAALTVTGVHAETHDGFDRVVLDLAGTGLPGWGTEVVEAAADDGYGEPVDLAGDRFVLLRLAGMELPVEGAHEPVEPQVLDVGGGVLTQVAVRSWFEGIVTVFLGVVGEDDPQVTAELHHDPLRLVVDVAHP